MLFIKGVCVDIVLSHSLILSHPPSFLPSCHLTLFFIMAAHFSFTTPTPPPPTLAPVSPSFFFSPVLPPFLAEPSSLPRQQNQQWWGPFCTRSHASLISLSFSVDAIRQQVHGALLCGGVNQGPCLKRHKLPAEWSIW